MRKSELVALPDVFWLVQIKNTCVTYLNLLVKPRIFFRFSGKNIILCILKGFLFFPEKK